MVPHCLEGHLAVDDPWGCLGGCYFLADLDQHSMYSHSHADERRRTCMHTHVSEIQNHIMPLHICRV